MVNVYLGDTMNTNAKIIERTMRKKRTFIELNKLKKEGVLFDIIPELQIIHKKHYNVKNTKDILQHSFNVVSNLKKIEMETKLNISNELYWAGLLHDIGKPFVAKYNKYKKRYMFIGHEYFSVANSYIILKRLGKPIESIEKTNVLIKYHMKLGGDLTTKRLKLMTDELNFFNSSLQELYILYFCDTSFPIKKKRNILIYDFTPEELISFMNKNYY